MGERAGRRAWVVALVLTLAACSGGDGSIATTSEPVPATEAPATTLAEATTETTLAGTAVGEGVEIRIPFEVPPDAEFTADMVLDSLIQVGFLDTFPGTELLSVVYIDGSLVFTVVGGTRLFCEELASLFGPADCSGFEDGLTSASPGGAVGDDSFAEPDEAAAAAAVESLLGSVAVVERDGLPSGTAFFFDDLGHLMTNAHVVAPGGTFTIVLIDGSRHAADVVGQVMNGGIGDAPDVAVLASTVGPSVAIGDPSTLAEGQPLLALGHPAGYGYWLATGGWYLGEEASSLVATTPSGSGGSGSPMFTESGEVVGLVWGEAFGGADQAAFSPPATVDVIWGIDEFEANREQRPTSWSVPIDAALALADAIVTTGGDVNPSQFYPPLPHEVNGTVIVIETDVEPASVPSITDGIANVIAIPFGAELVGIVSDDGRVFVEFASAPSAALVDEVVAFFAGAAAFVPGPGLPLQQASPADYPAPPDDAEAAAVGTALRDSVVVLQVIGAGFASGGRSTGVFMSEDGYILTNAHNVDDADPPVEVFVHLADGAVLPGTIIGWDLDKNPDVAVVKVDLDGVAVPSFGTSSSLSSGETVVAVGHPGGYGEWLVTAGEYTGLTFGDLLLTAPAREGSSGSPVVDLEGSVVGLVFGGVVPEELPVGRTTTDIVWSWEEFRALIDHGAVAEPIEEALATANTIIAANGNVP